MSDTSYEPHYAASRALVIGIDSYSDPRFTPLGEAEADAQAVAQMLQTPPYSFEVRTLLGEAATRRAILAEMFRLRSTALDDRVVVYFAGHGYTLSNRFGADNV